MARRSDRKKFHLTYKTTCLITRKCYYGMHSTDDLSDGYLGSGRLLRYSVKKYGRENHVRETIEMFPDRESLRHAEAALITLDRLSDPSCLNLYPGGGGYDEETMRNVSESLKGRKLSPEHCKKISERKKGKPPWNKGKTGLYKLSEEARAKLRKPAWNKGLTKETDERVARNAELTSAAMTGKPMSEVAKESRRRKPAWNSGLTKEDDPRLKGNTYWLGKTQTVEHRLKNSMGNKGRIHTEEARRNMSAARRRNAELKKLKDGT